MKKYIIAHDLGTSGNKATLYDSEGNLVASTVESYPLMTNGTAAEQNADDWWEAVYKTTKALSQKVDPSLIAAVSFSGQMMGCLCVDKNGKPLRNSLIWADMRSTKQEAEIRERIDPMKFYNITGHRISPSYSLTKLMWIKENEPQVYENTYKMLNAKDYIIYRLTDRFVTEPSDASATCLLDLKKLEWSDEILEISGISKDKLPEIIPSTAIAGTVTKAAAELTGLSEGTPVVCGGGDGCCAAVGTGVVKEGIANCCLGTSSWISMASKNPVCDDKMTVFNFAHIVPGYVLPCGTMQTGGGSLSWAANILFSTDKLEKSEKNKAYAAIEEEAKNSPVGANNLLFLPYLMGERSPRWNDKAKATFLGLTMDHTRGDILRAVMEGVGYNLDIILKVFDKNAEKINELMLVGGGARTNCWQTILSDIFGLPLLIPENLEEATSMGAAITAGVGVGIFENFDSAFKFINVKKKCSPNPENAPKYGKMKVLFEEAYKANEEIFEKLV